MTLFLCIYLYNEYLIPNFLKNTTITIEYSQTLVFVSADPSVQQIYSASFRAYQLNQTIPWLLYKCLIYFTTHISRHSYSEIYLYISLELLTT